MTTKLDEVVPSVQITPKKVLPKAANCETFKAVSKQTVTLKQEESKGSDEIKNNNKALSNMALADVVNESDDDDSVFINENKPKKASKTLLKHKSDGKLSIKPSTNVSSANNVSSLTLATNIKSMDPVAAQNHISSRDSNAKSETVVR